MNNILIREAKEKDFTEIQRLSLEWSNEGITYGFLKQI